jgi:hypothetical protein
MLFFGEHSLDSLAGLQTHSSNSEVTSNKQNGTQNTS